MLPSELLEAISAPGGSRVALVLGAGCSLEAPTCLPLARQCSEEVHQRLVSDNILVKGECANPEDLSCLADTVHKKTNSQAALVRRILDYGFKTATPNEGYLIAAALLLEGAMAAIVTLNFDLAISAAVSQLGNDGHVAVIDGPDELPNQSARNIYYLHRNANELDPEKWVLRTDVMKDQWKKRWEEHVSLRALIAPVVVFAGLGTPAAVLLESATQIRAATKTKVLQVDPDDADESAFFKALSLSKADFIKLKWCEFMELLADRVLVQQLDALQAAISVRTKDDNLRVENYGSVLDDLKSMGLLGFGHFRAALLLWNKPYSPDSDDRRILVADLIQAIPMIERISGGASARLLKHGVVEFHRPGKGSRFFLLASGRGGRGRSAIEPDVASRAAKVRNEISTLEGAIVAGTSDWNASISPPANIMGPITSHSIIDPSALELIHLPDLRSNPAIVSKVVP